MMNRLLFLTFFVASLLAAAAQTPPQTQPPLAPRESEQTRNVAPPQQAVRPTPAPAAQDASQGLTAMEALRRLTERFGKEAFATLVEMTGPNGQTQPTTWRVVTVDITNPYLTRTFFIDAESERDEGEGKTFYPDRIPSGFISLSRMSIGSYDAFVALDKAASEAKIGFDSIEYRLRAREGSNEPVWTITALDSDALAVGVVDVSGVSGIILRTVWLRRAGTRALPTVEDSALKKALQE
ncbi:MAG: hypothetical protein ACI9R3_000772 [Verrucomicrobiales bacterium]|jgi:hypothetical protein